MRRRVTSNNKNKQNFAVNVPPPTTLPTILPKTTLPPTTLPPTTLPPTTWPPTWRSTSHWIRHTTFLPWWFYFTTRYRTRRPLTLRYPPSTLRYPPSTLRYPPSTLRYPPSTLRYPPSTLRYPPSLTLTPGAPDDWNPPPGSLSVTDLDCPRTDSRACGEEGNNYCQTDPLRCPNKCDYCSRKHCFHFVYQN